MKSKPCLSPLEVVAELGRSMGDVSNFRPISEGEESRSYSFLSGSQRYVIRLNREREGFEKDAFAFRRFSSGNLPIPKVIRIASIDNSFYCVSEHVPGVTLQDLRAEDLPALMSPTARILDSIGNTDPDGLTGFGPFDALGAGRCESWRAFLSSVADPACHDWTAVAPLVELNSIRPLLARLERLVVHCPEIRRLVHGDFGSNNVLTDGKEIVSVIDWSEALIGDPLYDVANVFFWSTWLECMRQQAQYFEVHLSWSPELSQRLLCYQLRIGLGEIYQNALEGKADAVHWATSRCCELMT